MLSASAGTMTRQVAGRAVQGRQTGRVRKSGGDDAVLSAGAGTSRGPASAGTSRDQPAHLTHRATRLDHRANRKDRGQKQSKKRVVV